MKWARPIELQVEWMAPRVDMPNLGMHEPMNRHTLDDYAAADTGADGQVYEIVDVARRSPAMFGQGRRVDIGIETDGTHELPREWSGNIGAAPSWFGSLPDEAVARGSRIPR